MELKFVVLLVVGSGVIFQSCRGWLNCRFLLRDMFGDFVFKARDEAPRVVEPFPAEDPVNFYAANLPTYFLWHTSIRFENPSSSFADARLVEFYISAHSSPCVPSVVE